MRVGRGSWHVLAQARAGRVAARMCRKYRIRNRIILLRHTPQHVHPSDRRMSHVVCRVGKGCLVDRTIPIHARTLGLGVPPHVMGMYYRVVRPYSTNRSACC